MKNETKHAFWHTHLGIISFAIFAVGLTTILLSEQTSLLAIGATALLVAHIAAFGGAFLFGGGWITHKVRQWHSGIKEADHA